MHFPIALFTTALVLDLSIWARFRTRWLDRCAVLLYGASVLSALLAAVSGKLAAAAALPSLAPSVADLVETHGDWAFGAAMSMFVAAALRFEALHRDRAAAVPRLHRFRALALGGALVAGVVLWQTARRGGELVFRHGVGVERRAPREP